MLIFRSATGGSAIKAVEVILSHGVPENRIIFINLVCCSFYEIKMCLNVQIDCVSRRVTELLHEVSTDTCDYRLD